MLGKVLKLTSFTRNVAVSAAVASAYDPIADNKVPSAKEAQKTSYGTARRLKQQLAANTAMASTKPKVLWGGYVVTPPYWCVCMLDSVMVGNTRCRLQDKISGRRL